MESKDIARETKEKLAAIYESLSMVLLRQKIDGVLDKLTDKKTKISVTKILSDQ